MNRITLTDEKITKKLTDAIDLKYSDNFIPKIVIKIIKDCELEINFKNKEKKYQVTYELVDATVKITEIKKGKIKILNKYELNDSSLNLYKLSDCEEIRLNDIVNLNGNSKINYVLKTVANGLEKYNLDVYHNSPNTVSNVINHGINYKGSIDFNVSSFVLKDMKDCVANQVSRIINMSLKKCIIRPNLYINEYEVEAEHVALIDNFKDDEIFYLQRLGIDIKTAKKLLIKGFLYNEFDSEKIEIFKKYWR